MSQIESETDPRVQELLDIKRQRKILEEREKELIAELKTEMAEGEILLNHEGHGFRMTVQERREFGPDANAYLLGLGLLGRAAKVQQGLLNKLKESGELLPVDYDNVISLAKVKKVEVLADYVPEEAKVF